MHEHSDFVDGFSGSNKVTGWYSLFFLINKIFIKSIVFNSLSVNLITLHMGKDFEQHGRQKLCSSPFWGCFPQMSWTYLNKWSMKSANLGNFRNGLDSNSNVLLKSWVTRVLHSVTNLSLQILWLSNPKLPFLATSPLRYFLFAPERKQCFLYNRHAARAPESDYIPGNPMYPCRAGLTFWRRGFIVKQVTTND